MPNPLFLAGNTAAVSILLMKLKRSSRSSDWDSSQRVPAAIGFQSAREVLVICCSWYVCGHVWQDSSCSWLTRFPFRKRSGPQARGCADKQARKSRDIALAMEHQKLIAEKESAYEAAILPESGPGLVAELPPDHFSPLRSSRQRITGTCKYL